MGKILSVGDLQRLFEEKRVPVRRQFVGPDSVLFGNGYIDTTRSVLMTSVQVLSLIIEKETRDKAVI